MLTNKKNQKGIAVLFIPTLVIMLGFIIAAPLFVFSLVKSLSVSNVYQYLFSGDAAGVSYKDGVAPNDLALRSDALILPFDYRALKGKKNKCQPGNYYGGAGPAWTKNHGGIDYSLTSGTPLYAAATGQITAIKKDVKAGYWPCSKGSDDAGNFITLKITSGSLAGKAVEYHHILFGSIPENLNITSTVNQGQFIGRVGSTGCSTNAHLHFQLNRAQYANSGPNYNKDKTEDPLPALGCQKIGYGNYKEVR
ncbi:MAG: M23 family metallopeptidase [Patescibacteria group bacterium]|nr:M23 family metallopeptidase [Patescibacteria group bacterium]